MTAVAFRSYALPWDLTPGQDRRFRAITRNVLTGTVVLSIVLSLLPVPEIQREPAEAVPPRFAKLLLEKPEPPPPPPPVEVVREPEPVKPEPVPEPEPVIQPKPEPADKRQPVKTARDKAKVAGLLPFADELADLRDNQTVVKVTSSKPLAGAAGDAATVERSLITSKAGKASAGINTADMSRDTGGAGLSGRETTAVSSTVAGLSASGPQVQSGTQGQRPSRSREEIEMVFDKNKGAIYAIYNRALRRDPTLQGKLVLKLTIEPSGVISACEVVSSELENPDLERKLVQRVKLFRFADKDVAPVTTTKPIDFFPA